MFPGFLESITQPEWVRSQRVYNLFVKNVAAFANTQYGGKQFDIACVTLVPGPFSASKLTKTDVSGGILSFTRCVGRAGCIKFQSGPSRAAWHVIKFIFTRAFCAALERNTHEMTSLGRRAVFTIDTVNLKTMLSLKSKDYSIGNRPSVMGPLLGRAIFVTDGEEWSHSRAVLRPSFNKTQVANLSIIELHFQHLLKQLCASVVEGKDAATIDLQELFLRFTMDSSTEFLFGESTNTLTAGDHAFSNAFTYSLRDISLSLRMGPWAKFRRTDPKAAESHRICREYVDRYADQALRYRRKIDSGDSKQDDNETSILIKELANSTGDRERIRDELLGLLLAGRDTTASLLSSLFSCLAKRPDIWDKVREEVANELPNGSLPTYDQLKSIKYARYCINESKWLFFFFWPSFPPL